MPDSDQNLLHVTITENPCYEPVDEEIVVVSGCALGFVAANSPPHVLHIEEHSPLESAGVNQDDILYMVSLTPPKNRVKQDDILYMVSLTPG